MGGNPVSTSGHQPVVLLGLQVTRSCSHPVIHPFSHRPSQPAFSLFIYSCAEGPGSRPLGVTLAQPVSPVPESPRLQQGWWQHGLVAGP